MNEPKPRTEHWTPNPNPSSIIVPGVDTTASINAQIDQIDQLITIRLQNIDANFSRIQHIISTKLLPAFKRYAEGTEPVREAAKFWKSFYEAAAQVRIPIATDASFLNHTENDDSEEPDTSIQTIQSEQDPDRTPANINDPPDDSFARGAPASSTPLVRDPINLTHLHLKDNDDDESWTASIESPFERLGRQVKELAIEEAQLSSDYPSTSTAPSFSPLHGNYTNTLPRPPQPSHTSHGSEFRPSSQLSQPRRKGKTPLRQNVLRQNAAIAAAPRTTLTPSTQRTPLSSRTPKNPFFPSGSKPRAWDGLVDLRHPSPAKYKALHAPQTAADNGYDSDSSDDLFPPGMSPPVTMQFAMQSRAPTSVALTPARRAAERIRRDLVSTASGRTTGSTRRVLSPAKTVEASLSSDAPSLLSLTRFSARAPEYPTPSTHPTSNDELVTPAHQIYRSRLGPEAYTHAAGSTPSLPDPRRLIVDEATVPSPGSTDSDHSSEHDESNPSAAFLFATQNNAHAGDDSFASSSSDEDGDGNAGAHPLAHLFAGTGREQGMEDSFDGDETFTKGEETETVFGARQVGQGRIDAAGVRMMRDALLDDTHPGAVSLNPFAQVEQSPTPYAGQMEELRGS